MPAPNPNRFPKHESSFDTLATALKKSLKRPFIGVTQGGSSRKDRGAKPAATTAKFNPRTQMPLRSK